VGARPAALIAFIAAQSAWKLALPMAPSLEIAQKIGFVLQKP
jgi:hypothetical protein